GDHPPRTGQGRQHMTRPGGRHCRHYAGLRSQRGGRPAEAAVQHIETVEIRGHVIDTGVLARGLDDGLEYGGDYKVTRLDLGRQHHDESYARVEIGCEDPIVLQRILMRLQIHGVNLVDPGAAVLRPADKDGVFPEDFYSTTNLETQVKLEGRWVPVAQPEMDCGLVVRDGSVRTVPVADVRAGDLVVCGASGGRVVLPAAAAGA